MKICVIIPTLNEEKNINKIFFKIKKTKIKLDVLFVDDNSTDKSQELITKLSKRYKNVNYIFRKNKTGIGSDYPESNGTPDYYTVDYSSFTPIAISAIQKLHYQLKELEELVDKKLKKD